MVAESNYISGRKLLIFLLHLLAWAVFIFYPFIFYRTRVIGSEFYYKQIINAAFLAGVFYFSLYYLYPRIIRKCRLFLNSFFILLLVGFIPLQQYVLEYYIFKSFENKLQIISPLSNEKIAEFHSVSPQKEIKIIVRHDSIMHGRFFSVPLPAHRMFFNETLPTSIPSVLFVLLLSGFISVAGELFRTEKKRKELENQRLNAELAFLKSQVNPHFFFNTLNAIYLLAHKKSDQTEHVVIKLSEIMRYMIYESNAPEVRLQREIEYLGDYIGLQRMRLSKKVDVNFVIEGQPGNLMIAPVLLVPFVENAFKHGVSYAGKAFIFIGISITGDEITFTSRNRLFGKSEKPGESSGVGLANVQKRLAILYPNCHSLAVNTENNEFNVELKIVLNHDPMFGN